MKPSLVGLGLDKLSLEYKSLELSEILSRVDVLGRGTRWVPLFPSLRTLLL